MRLHFKRYSCSCRQLAECLIDRWFPSRQPGLFQTLSSLTGATLVLGALLLVLPGCGGNGSTQPSGDQQQSAPKDPGPPPEGQTEPTSEEPVIELPEPAAAN